MKKQVILGIVLLCAPLFATAAKNASIPKMFLGHWEPSQETCNNVLKNGDAQSDMGVVITAKEVSRYESSCELQSIGQITATSMQGTFNCGSSEEMWESTFSLVLQNNQLFAGPEADPLVKCKK